MWCSTPCRDESHPLTVPRLQRQGVWLAWASLLLAGWPAAAQTVLSTDAPPATVAATHAHPQLAGSRLQGQGSLRFLGMRIYHARLWTLGDFRSEPYAQQPLVLELEYLRALQGSAIAERSLQEMRRIGPISDAQAQRWLAQMQRLFPDVQPGDRITGQLLPGQGADFWHNGRRLGRVGEAEFASLFFGIWLSAHTSEPDLRLALLGQVRGSVR